jgi:hypothetical protein
VIIFALMASLVCRGPCAATSREGTADVFHGRRRAEVANLRANPHVVLTTGCNRWDQGLDVVVEGDAVQVTDDAVLSRVAGAFAAKWDGRWQFSVRDGCFRLPYV